MTNPNHGTISSNESQKDEEIRRVQEQLNQQQAHLRHLEWKKSASV